QGKGADVDCRAGADGVAGVQGQSAIGGGDAGVEVDVIVGLEGQGVTGAPGQGIVDGDVARVATTGIARPAGVQRDVLVVVQVDAEGGTAEGVARGGADDDIGRVDQPGTALAARRIGGDGGAV